MNAVWLDFLDWLGIKGNITECPPSFKIPDNTVLAELDKFYAQHSENPNFPAEQYAILLSGVQSRLLNETLMGWAMDLVFANSEDDIYEMLPGMSEEHQAALQGALALIQGRIDAADEARVARVAAARDEADRVAAIAAADEADRVAAIAAADEADRVAAIAAADEADRDAAIAAAHAADEADRDAAARDEADRVATIYIMQLTEEADRVAAARGEADQVAAISLMQWTEEVALQLRRGHNID